MRARRATALTPLAITAAVALATMAAQSSRHFVSAGDSGIHPLFDLAGPETCPFPSDRFTVADDDNLSRRRINLPLSADCVANKSECDDVAVVNQLDGFSLRPRISIPFDGDINPATVAGNVFFISLGDTTDSWNDNGSDSVPSDHRDHEGMRKRSGFGRVIGINEIVWDPTTRVLYANPDRLLEEHTRYALVVTSGIRDASGKPLRAHNAFRDYRNRLTGSMDLWYRKALLAAEWAARHSENRRTAIIGISSFTTQSVSYLREKITNQLIASPPPVADFSLGPGRARARYAFSSIQSITHNQQTTPTERLKPVEVNLTGARWVPGAIGDIVYGKFTAPDFMVHPGEYIPAIRSRSGTPAPQGSNTLYFTLILPSGEKPPRGWPVVVFGHGGGGNRVATPFEIASIPASRGLALICIDNVGHGFGSASSQTLETTSGSSLTLPAPGRGFDQNGDGTIDPFEGHIAKAPRQLGLYSDATVQSGADHLSLIRLLQGGIDADGDGQIDLDASRIYFLGQSLGAHQGIPLMAYVQAIRAATFIVPFGTSVRHRLLSPHRTRPTMGSMLAARQPSLLNSAHGLTSIGGMPVTPPFFDENAPFRDGPALTNTVPGAMDIQRLWDRMEWRGQTGDATVFARKLRKSPPSAVSARPFYIHLGRGDQTNPVAESRNMVREAEIKDRVVLYRHDLFFANNPKAVKTSHTVYRFQGANAPTNPITVAIQEQFAQFFASDGAALNRTSQYLETPMTTSLPGKVDYIP